MRKIYLDYAATTPVGPAVLAAMQPYFFRKFGNPGSLHFFGQEAMAAVDESREKIARAIGADFREIIFTGSATEANNLALRGTVRASGIKKPRIITSAIEHESILKTCRDLEKEGVKIIYLPVNREGIVDLGKLKESLNERTILVSVQYANNEIGTIQSIEEITSIIKNWKLKIKNSGLYPLFHTDNAQGFQYLDLDIKKLGIDLMTLSAHKIYGPKGIGALYVNSKILNPIVTGGGQEFGLRSGTENVPLIVGFAKAVEKALDIRHQESERVSELCDYFWRQIKKISPKAQINGPAKNRLPNNLNIYFPGKSAEDLLIKLDIVGVAVSAGSACSARGTEPSHILKACGFPLERIKSSLRITLGRPTSKGEIGEAIKRIKVVIKN